MTWLPRPWLTALLTTLVAVVLCFVPLFDLLGYESSAAMAAVLGIAVMVRTSWLFDREELTRPLAADRDQGPLADFMDLLPWHLALAVPPALVLLANALRVKNCDLTLGLQFWLVLPVVSIVAGQALGFVTGLLPRLRIPAGLLVVAAQTVALLGRLAWEPPIAGHTWTIGWFAGSIYDEALSLPRHLLWARFGVLVLSAVLVVGVQALWEAREGWRRGTRPALVALLAMAAVLHTERQELGIQPDEAFVQQQLGGRLESEHFVIWFEAGSLDPAQQALLVEDHEFRYAELEAFFGTDPVAWKGRPIDVFVYPNRAAQYRLMRSRRTLVARPWTHQMHIRWDGYGDNAVAHELAHLFTAEFGAGPARLATRGGLMPDLGLVEGVAVAADDEPDELSLDQRARAMRELGLAPDLSILLGPGGFWTQPGPRAYTLVGSFVNWLIATRGIASFREVYGRGDWQGVYGQPLDALVAEWGAHVDAVPLTDAQRELAGFRYRRGSIFQRVCARTIAELERQADGAEARGDLETALLLREQIRDLEPGNVEHRLALARLRTRRGEAEAAAAILDRLLERPQLQVVQRLRILEEKGDLAWRRGDLAAAQAAYTECRVPGRTEGELRQLTVKLAGSQDDGDVGTRALQYMLGDENSRTSRLWLALEWAREAPDDPLPRYLVGRVLLSDGQYADASDWLDQPLSDPFMDEERRLLRAEAWFHDGDSWQAQGEYGALIRETDSSRVRALASEGLARTLWREGGAL
ncbi:MAG: hypothetical protein H6742_09015 [Alphaproteobacteria bacterium]|nr:hypothetical protein [Alphaproteobacteria bacterium]